MGVKGKVIRIDIAMAQRPDHLRADAGHSSLPRPAARQTPHRVQRFFEIVRMLVGGQEWSSRELAGWFEVSERTILRDMDTLVSAGMVVRGGGRKSGYRLAEEAAWERPRLSLRQVVTLLVLAERGREQSSERVEPSERDVARAAVAKLLLPLPTEMRKKLEQVQGLLAGCTAAQRGWLCSQVWLPTFLEAIAGHRALRIWLLENGDTPFGEHQVIIPDGLKLLDGRWVSPALQIGGSDLPLVELDRVAAVQFDVHEEA